MLIFFVKVRRPKYFLMQIPYYPGFIIIASLVQCKM